jgi:hygromycin-B 7''-O-kinase
VKRPYFIHREAYAAQFTDPHYWQPYVAAICERHGFACRTIRAGLPGTNAVFLVDNQYAVKLYPDLFDGARSYPAERECYAMIAAAGDIPAPTLLASGELFDAQGGWPWPYLVTQVLPGSSLTEQADLIIENRRALADWLGALLRRIHGLSLTKNQILRPEWHGFQEFIAQQRASVTQRHSQWACLPSHLIAQLETYLPSANELIDATMPPCLIHADLNADHVLGAWDHGSWQPGGIIDFGDARVGDPVYELVALHLGLFAANKKLLAACLASYKHTAILRDLPQRAMAYTLLHEFNVLDGLEHTIATCATLEAAAEVLWGLRG